MQLVLFMVIILMTPKEGHPEGGEDMKKERKTNGASIPAPIVAELERQHLKATAANYQILKNAIRELGEAPEVVNDLHLDRINRGGRSGFVAWFYKPKADQIGKPWGVQLETNNDRASFIEGLESMSPREWIGARLARISAKEWKEGKEAPAFRIEKLANNRPSTLTAYINARPMARVWFVYIHVADRVGDWRAVVGTFDPETQREGAGGPCAYLFQEATRYTGRKHAAAVYAISTPRAPEEAKQAKQAERVEARPGAEYWRYSGLKIETSKAGDKVRPVKVQAHQIGGGAACLYDRYKMTGAPIEGTYSSASEIEGALLDRSGYYITERRARLYRRAWALKLEHQAAAAAVHDYQPGIEALKATAAKLGGLMGDLLEEFNNTRAAEPWGAFYYSYLNKRIAHQIESINRLIDQALKKEFNSVAEFETQTANNQRRAEALELVVADWLTLPEDQRGHDGPKERAIYYEQYIIQDGRLIYTDASLN